jgi:hypothetical protein
VFRIRKHFWLLSSDYRKWYFLTEKCGQGPKTYKGPRTPNARYCGRKPLNKLVCEFRVSQFVVCRARLVPLFSGCKHCNQTITQAGKSFVSGRFKSASINLIFCEHSFLPMKRVLHETEFLIATTLIFSSTNPGGYSKFCKDSGQSPSKGTGVYKKSRRTF